MNEAIKYLRDSGILKTGSLIIVVGGLAIAGLSIYKNFRDIKLTDLRIKEIEGNLNKEA